MTAVMSPICRSPALIRPPLSQYTMTTKKLMNRKDRPSRLANRRLALIEVAGIGLKSGTHTIFLPSLIVERPDYPHARNIFQKNGGHPVKELLQLPEQRSGAVHNKHGQNEHDGHHRQQNGAHLPIQAEGQQYVTERSTRT